MARHAGKISPLTIKKKVDGKTVKEVVPDEFTLAASGVKEIGAVAVRALTNADSNPGRLVRNRKQRPAEGEAA